MNDRAAQDLTMLLPPLLNALDALTFVSRYFHPPHLRELMAVIGAPEDHVREARESLAAWPDALAGLRAGIEAACDVTLAGFLALREATHDGAADGMRAVYRALRALPRAQEALYPLTAGIPPVNRYFLNPAQREDSALQHALLGIEPREDIGVLHARNGLDTRGGFSLYVPEYYSADTAWPLIVALHGGAGHGRGFLWTWLRDARSLGAIVVAPTSVGPTWALADEDPDTPNLARIIEFVRDRWNIDDTRLLMTGMSDGGTFCYASGLESTSPFTHLAPIAASFHPVLAQMADPDRLSGLPIHIAHGALDWMFPVDIARQASQSLAAAGAAVTYVEIDDLSHAYPYEQNADIIGWLRRA